MQKLGESQDVPSRCVSEYCSLDKLTVILEYIISSKHTKLQHNNKVVWLHETSALVPRMVMDIDLQMHGVTQSDIALKTLTN